MKLFDEAEINSLYPDLKLVAGVGSGDWKDSLYFSPSINQYIEKGAFGPHDAICFRLSEIVKDEQTKVVWVEQTRANWKKYFPTISI